jgi:hypothetical protein
MHVTRILPIVLRGVSVFRRTYSDDQSRSPGFMMVVVMTDVSDWGFGILRIPTPTRSNDLKCVSTLEVLAQVFTSTFIQSVLFKSTSCLPGRNHPSILEHPNTPRSESIDRNLVDPRVDHLAVSMMKIMKGVPT